MIFLLEENDVKMQNHKKTTIVLLSLWIVSLVSATVYYLHQTVAGRLSSSNAADVQSAIPFLLTLFYFFPLLLLIKKYSNFAEMKAINKFARLLIPIFLLFSIIAPVAFLLSCLM